MLEKKFFKNLYQTINWLGVILVLQIPLIAGYFDSLQFGENNGWLLLVISAIIVFLFFAIGFYWFFQKVVIDKNGITILFFNKIIKHIAYCEVEKCKITFVMRSPSITIYTINKKHINLDHRKKITESLRYYGIEMEYDSAVL